MLQRRWRYGSTAQGRKREEGKREGGLESELRIGLPEEQMVTNREEDRQKRREEGEEEAAAHIFAPKPVS